MSEFYPANPYTGLETEEERQKRYEELNDQYRIAQTSYERNRKVYEDGIKAWEENHNIQIEQDTQFDKNILLISGGSFGVSFAFIDKVVPLQQASYFPILCLAWALFAFTLVVSLLGFRLSSFVHSKMCDDVHKNISRGYEGSPYQEKKHWYGIWLTRLCNWLSFLGFGGGVGCLIAFVFLNA
jgi:hypothetical protein